MLDKIRALPEKLAFAIGLSLILISPIILLILPDGKWTAIVQGIILGIGILFILCAADKRHSNKKHNSKYVK